jgi:hypothetical protein
MVPAMVYFAIGFVDHGINLTIDDFKAGWKYYEIEEPWNHRKLEFSVPPNSDVVYSPRVDFNLYYWNSPDQENTVFGVFVGNFPDFIYNDEDDKKFIIEPIEEFSLKIFGIEFILHKGKYINGCFWQEACFNPWSSITGPVIHAWYITDNEANLEMLDKMLFSMKRK